VGDRQRGLVARPAGCLAGHAPPRAALCEIYELAMERIEVLGDALRDFTTTANLKT
jgi:hypothetical protein